MTELEGGDMVKVVGEIDLEGLDPDQAYRVVEVKTVAGRRIYLMRPTHSVKNDVKHLTSDIDYYLGRDSGDKPRIDLVN